MTEDRPGWARRITREREARGWSQAEAVRALRVHSPDTLPVDSNMLRQWKRWEAGEVMPSEFYRQIIAATFGTVTHSMFPVAPQVTRTLNCWLRRGWTRWSWSAGCSAPTSTRRR